MIQDKEIEQKAQEFGIKPTDVEKDYIHGWLLNGLYTQSPLANQLILKGGNGLRKAYLPNTRFSKDLDFSLQQPVEQALLERELNRVCEFVEHATGVRFSTDRTVVNDKDLHFDVEALEARLYFKGFYGDENITLKAQLDITQFDKIYLPIQARQLLHPYSDAPSCAATLRCQKIEEILASKLTTLLHRRKAIDLFDLLYSIIFTKEFPVERLQVISTFLRKSIFEPQPTAARDQLLAVPLDDYRPLWDSIVAPVRSLFNFDYVVSNFKGLIESLFSVIVPQGMTVAAVGPAFGGGGMPRITRRPVPMYAAYSPAYFSWNVRNAIVAAGRSQTLVEIVYDGFRRLVEPYKIEYYMRKKDGRGLEYFWGYDHSGGSSGPGIKRFICDKIQSARETGMPFVPQFQIEL